MSDQINVDEFLKDHSEIEQMPKKVSRITKVIVGLFSILMLVGSSFFLINNYGKLFDLDKVELEDYFLISDLEQASIGIYYNELLQRYDYEKVLELMVVNEELVGEDIDYLASKLDHASYLSQAHNLKYQLEVDEDVMSNFARDIQEDLNEDIKTLNNGHLLVAQILFDNKGEPTVAYIHGVEQRFFEESYESILTNGGIGIKDATLTLAIPNDLANHDWLYYSLTNQIYNQMLLLLSIFSLGLGSIIGLVVLFTPYRISSQLGLLRMIDKLPVELNLVAIIGVVVTQFILACNILIPVSVTGELERIFMEELMMGADQATMIMLAINMIYWIVFFGFIYAGVYIIKTLFVKGLFRFIKEHSFIYKTLNYIRKSMMRTMKWVFSVDLKQKHSKKLLAFVGINFIVLSVMCAMWFFGIIAAVIYSIVLYVVIDKVYKKIRADYETLVTDIQTLADGRLDVELDDNYGVFNDLKDELLDIQSGFKHAVSKEVKSQNMKTELIANVSHDLKTPLTSIVTYVDLLKDETLEEAKQKEYLEIIDRKADRLKVLIEDLFEMSKASSGDITLNVEEVNIVSLLKQTVFELEDCLAESDIIIRQNYSDEKVKLMLDPLRTYRIFENLVLNISKYSMPRSRAYIEVVELDKEVQVIFKNISAEEITVNPEDLKERFVRGDEARHTEGSGLGLAICQTFVELQGGTFEILIDGDLFKTVIKFKK